MDLNEIYEQAEREDKLVAVVKYPYQKPEAVAIDKGLTPIQKTVGGNIDVVYLPDIDDIHGFCNDDGLFIGNAAGDDGIAAINIVWPVVAFITSLGTGIGVGGSGMFPLVQILLSKGYSISGSDTPFELISTGSVAVVPVGMASRRFRKKLPT